MARAQGFARGDFDTSFPIDDKFLALRHAVEPGRYYAAAGVYWHIVAAAWREVERKPAGRICPDAEAEIADLMSVQLLETDERLPNRAFVAYIGRAKRQRLQTSARQRQHREGMSRVSHGASRVTERESHGVTVSHNPARVQGEVGRGKEDTTGGAGGAADRDSLDTYHELTLYRPWGEFSGDKLKVAINDYGDSTVEAALRAEYGADIDRKTLLNRCLARLARDADRKRTERKTTRRTVRVVTSAERAAALQELREETA